MTISFVLIAERGDLEPQACLLVESLRTFGGRHSDSEVWVVQPRSGLPLRRSTSDCLASLGAHIVRTDANDGWPEYPLANKPAAAAFIESLVQGRSDVLAFLDSDTLVLGPPDDLELESGIDLAIRPVDERLIASDIREEPSAYWSALYDACDTDPAEVWSVETNVERLPIRAYFNTGVMAVRPELGLFGTWKTNLARAAECPDRATVFGTRQKRWFVEQATFAATALAACKRDRVRLLGPAYNYPLHKQHALPDGVRFDSVKDIRIAHYHNAFYTNSWRREFTIGEPQKAWLSERLPLPGWGRRIGRAAEEFRLGASGSTRLRGMVTLAEVRA